MNPCASYTPRFEQQGDYRTEPHNIFRPPLTPGSPWYGQDHLSVTRKRLRADSSPKVNTRTVYDAFANGLDGWTGDEASERANSPAPLANPSYTLANGFDTPSLVATGYYERPGAEEMHFRRRWDVEVDSPPDHDDMLGGPLARERNGHGRMGLAYDLPPSPQTSGGWGSFVFGLASTVAGKIVSFCRDRGAFRGFYAGDGKGYEFSQPTNLDLDHSWAGYFGSSTMLPGQFPQDQGRHGGVEGGRMLEQRRDFSGDFEQDNTPARPRPAKRLHTETGNGWVVVEDNLDTREVSPRLSTRKTSASLASRPSKPTASRDSRRSLIPVSRRTSSNLTYTGSPLFPSPDLDPATCSPILPQSHRERRKSNSPARSTFAHSRQSSHPSRIAAANASSLSPQAQKILARKDRRNKDADKSMSKMNKQLQQLIRQGQAALGTKFEIEHDNIDDDFEHGDAEGWEDAGAEAILKW